MRFRTAPAGRNSRREGKHRRHRGDPSVGTRSATAAATAPIPGHLYSSCEPPEKATHHLSTLPATTSNVERTGSATRRVISVHDSSVGHLHIPLQLEVSQPPSRSGIRSGSGTADQVAIQAALTVTPSLPIDWS